MGSEQAIFAVKLCELEQEYGRLQSEIRLFQERDETQLREELARLRDEHQEHQLLLDERVRAGRSPSAAALSEAQLEHSRRAERILAHDLPEEMRGRNHSSAWDRAEAMSLYAEYAIDFATQAMRQAMIAALSAMISQQQADREAAAGQKKEDNDE
ncbi:MAG TPA: hypothetical protein H9719_10735 [Candidatus Intestinimonas stercoravium]|nr:hypothetical protein [Candidatus Intestinimonas stercoravium]